MTLASRVPPGQRTIATTGEADTDRRSPPNDQRSRRNGQRRNLADGQGTNGQRSRETDSEGPNGPRRNRRTAKPRQRTSEARPTISEAATDRRSSTTISEAEKRTAKEPTDSEGTDGYAKPAQRSAKPQNGQRSRCNGQRSRVTDSEGTNGPRSRQRTGEATQRSPLVPNAPPSVSDFDRRHRIDEQPAHRAERIDRG